MSLQKIVLLLLSVLLLGSLGCYEQAAQVMVPPPAASDAPSPSPDSTPAVSEISVNEVEPTETPTTVPTATPSPEPTPSPTPEPTATPVPTPQTAVIGAVGDIMIPSGIIGDVRSGSNYDFSALFAPCAELFSSVDLMCANLEVPLAGESAGYSAMLTGETGIPRFNAPDSLLDALKDAGFDLLTTANNHVLDKETDGMYRTTEVIRDAGFYQTGTFLDEDDRETPCIIEVNGIRIGIVAATRVINERIKHITMDEAHVAVGLLSEGDQLTDDVLEDLERVKDAGAEFIIVFAHWDYENPNPVDKITRRLAEQLLKAGADCIIGSHPHYVKSIEYTTVLRGREEYTGLVAYSLGNFTANEGFERSTGLYLQLTLEKDFETDTVSLIDAAYLPTFVMRRAIEKPRFTAFPVFEDTSSLKRFDLSRNEQKSFSRAREYAMNVIGEVDGLRLLDE